MSIASTPTSYFLLASLLYIVVVALTKLLVKYVWRPWRIQKALQAQGILGLPYRPFVGNFPDFARLWASANTMTLPLTTHHIIQKVLFYHIPWSAQYGKNYLFWLGNVPLLVLSDPDLCKEVLYDKLGHYPKGKPLRPDVADFFTNGLVFLEGERWSQHRTMVNPAFHMKRLKALTPKFTNLVATMLDIWQSKLETAKDQVEIDVNEEFKTLTADVIAHTGFGSSYAEGKEVFLLQREQQKLLLTLIGSFYIPGSRFFPTALNRHRWKLSKQIQTGLEGIIRKRLDSAEGNESGQFGDDLLGLMLSAFKEESEGSRWSKKMTLQDVVDECKTFFFAGHETTAALLIWSAMLLSINPEWQEKAREEVINLFGRSPPDAESLHQMKVVGMILNETLRLYPPVPSIIRETPSGIKLGDVTIPPSVSFVIPLLALQVDPTLWGPDAHDFNPQRFANGIPKACKHPAAFKPFSAGPRNCVGLNFAMIEAKITMCMILQRFRFRLSPGYRHSPINLITLHAEHGMQIIVEALG